MIFASEAVKVVHIEMDKLAYSPLLQFRVLQSIEQQCGIYGERLVQLTVEGLESREISQYCRLLKELGMAETTTYQDMDGDVYFPIRITAKGVEYLSEINKAFWEQAEKVACEAVKHWTGFDIMSAVKFFKTTAKKYRQDRGS